jgi:DHA1 family bicyclomycin/chloramphenicol resistance-like MFS transporter
MQNQFSNKQTQGIVWTLLFLMPIIGMAVDLVAPSLPAITNTLKISPQLSKEIISLYLLGYGLGNLVSGFLTDAYGRKKLLRFCLLGFLVMSFLPILFLNIKMLLLARFLQGIMLGGVSVVIRAVFSDILDTAQLIRLSTMIGTMWGLGPVLGPAIGGYLQFYFGWKSCFYFFVIIAAVMSGFVWKIIPETLNYPSSLDIKTIKTNLFKIIRHREYMAIVVLMGFSYSLIIAFNVGGPFFIQSRLHYSSVFFGYSALFLGLVFLSSTFTSRYFLKQKTVEQLHFWFINLFFAVIGAFLIISYFFSQSIILFIVMSALMFFVTGLVFPMSMGKGLSFFRHISGTATALMYFVNMSITSGVSFALGFFNIKNVTSMAWAYFFLLLVCMAVFWSFLYKPEKTDLETQKFDSIN